MSFLEKPGGKQNTTHPLFVSETEFFLLLTHKFRVGAVFAKPKYNLPSTNIFTICSASVLVKVAFDATGACGDPGAAPALLLPK